MDRDDAPDGDTLWRAALEVDTLCAGCHGNLAVSLETRGFTAAAIEHFEQALALRPDDTGYHRRNIGLTLYKTGRLSQAIAQFRLGLEQNPTDVEIRNYLGVALIQQGTFDEAARELRQVIRLEPNRAGALTNLATALAALGRPAEAVPYFERAIAVNPRDPISRFGLTRAHLALGDCAAARAQAEVLRGLDPRLVEPALAVRREGDDEVKTSCDERSPRFQRKWRALRESNPRPSDS